MSYTHTYIGHSGCAERNYFRYSGGTLHGTRFYAVNSDICVRCHVAYQRLRGRRIVRTYGWTCVDQTDDPQRLHVTAVGVWHGLLHQFHRNVLPRQQSDTVWIHGT